MVCKNTVPLFSFQTLAHSSQKPQNIQPVWKRFQGHMLVVRVAERSEHDGLGQQNSWPLDYGIIDSDPQLVYFSVDKFA